MKIFKLNATKITIIGLLISLLLALYFSFISTSVCTAEINEKPRETKIYSSYDIEDDFDDSSVVVIMDKQISNINKKYPERFFGDFPKTRITDLTYITDNIESSDYLDKENFRQILKIELPERSKKNVLSIIKKLEKIEGILWAGPNLNSIPIAESDATLGTQYPQQWGLHGSNGIKADQAWNLSTGSKNVRVGIIDTGVANHSDYNDNLTSGWDFFNKNAITNDTDGHGTHVAGIIGATGTTENGVKGVCPNAQLVPLQVINNKNDLDWQALVAAIKWASTNSIDIINFSIGYYGEYLPIKTSIENYKGLFVCSAGNDDSNNDTRRHYPSDYSQGQSFSDRVISVGAINESGDRAYFTAPKASNYGAQSVSLFAPGANILSTYLQDGYALYNGTSMAAPFVTGTAALMASVIKSKPYDLSQAQMSALIKSTILDTVTVDKDNLGGLCVTEGRLNAYKAVSRLRFPTKERIFDNVGYEGSTFYWNGKMDAAINDGSAYYKNSSNQMVFTKNTFLNLSLSTLSSSNAWAAINGKITFQLTNQFGAIIKLSGNDSFVSTVDVNLVNSVTIGNPTFSIDIADCILSGTYTLTMTSEFKRMDWSDTRTQTFTFKVERPSSSCVAEGSLITLADGTQKAVEELTGDERLLVWNMFTGKFDSAPILFIDSDPRKEYEVTNVKFSDGTSVKVIDEHGFWDFDLNEYVFLRKDAAKYIGHWFNKQTMDGDGNLTYKRVQLIDVEVKTEYTSAWSPVTYGHLCYYVNGMLSMPGATEGLINIFDVDSETMKIDQAAYAADIAKYGLFTYEEFAGQYPVPEVIFEAFGGQYLKVAMGKDLLTAEMLESLIAKYSIFFEA